LGRRRRAIESLGAFLAEVAQDADFLVAHSNNLMIARSTERLDPRPGCSEWAACPRLRKAPLATVKSLIRRRRWPKSLHRPALGSRAPATPPATVRRSAAIIGSR
jgi:hypothetical protein